MPNIMGMLERYALVKAIKTLSSWPNRSFSVRELAKTARLSVGASAQALSYMKKTGIATLAVIGRTHQYRANLESPLCRQWKMLFNTEMIENSGVVAGLRERIPDVQSILLYGSSARGTNDEKSDIDMLVISHKPAKADLGFVRRLGKDANVAILSLADWKRKAEKDRVFYENVIYDSIVLYGERPVVL